VIARFAADPLFQATLHGVASLLFLSAALHKLRGPAEFRAALGGYGLLPTAALGIAGTGLAALELALGVALLIPATGGVAGAVGAALMLLYAAGMAWNLRRGRAHIDCGCGGPGGRRPLSRAGVWRNVALAGVLALAALPASARPVADLEWIHAALATGALALLYAAADVALANAARLRWDGGVAWSTD